MKLTPEEIKSVQQDMHRVWDYIASDIGEAEGVGNTIPRDEVIELVVDADRLLTHGTNKEAVKKLYALDYKEIQKIGREAFPFKRYEV